MKPGIKSFFIYFFVLAFFTLTAVLYFYPVLQGKIIYQSDIVQYTGMAREQIAFRKSNDTEPFWTNSAFGGMPTYQLGAKYPYDFVGAIDDLIRFLPRPADYLFLYLFSFFILLGCLKIDYRLAVLGALAFGFSTYLIIIIGVGHNAKAHAIGYLPMLLGGIILTFRKKYLWGFLLTAFAMALEINANHYQMTYYFGLLVLVLGISYLIIAIRTGQLAHYGKSVGILLVAVVLGIATNATAILTTQEYANWSTRGNSELTVDPLGNPKPDTSGLSKEYITQYSYGIAESMNIFVPRLFGGSNSEDLGEDSKTFDFLIDQGIPRTQALKFASSIPLYWGDQPGVAAPAYVGAVVFFLFLLSLFLVRGYPRYWLIAGAVMSLVLSWGKNLPWLTDFMIDYFPLYNKFRAVSSIQVILELCIPVLGILALATMFNEAVSHKRKELALRNALIVTGALMVLLLVLRAIFDFTGLNDNLYAQYYGAEIMEMIKRDRETVYLNDTFRSFLFMALAGGTLLFYLKKRLKNIHLIILLGLLIVIDLIGVDLRYVNSEDFVSKRAMRDPFREDSADKLIAQDQGVFRVYDTGEGINGARTSYFHNSIGGYHAAKPAGIQDLFEYHIYNNNVGVLNMLNVKYVIQQDEGGNRQVTENPSALGNAWFISTLRKVNTADEEIGLLDDIDLNNTAVVNIKDFPNLNRFKFQVDSTAQIRLVAHNPNHLTYATRNPNSGIGVFSEMYYANGWNAYIDGKLTPHFRVNYVLRALRIPEGEHTVEFKFEPEVINVGSKIVLASSVLLFLVALGALFYQFKPLPGKEKHS